MFILYFPNANRPVAHNYHKTATPQLICGEIVQLNSDHTKSSIVQNIKNSTFQTLKNCRNWKFCCVLSLKGTSCKKVIFRTHCAQKSNHATACDLLMFAWRIPRALCPYNPPPFFSPTRKKTPPKTKTRSPATARQKRTFTCMAISTKTLWVVSSAPRRYMVFGITVFCTRGLANRRRVPRRRAFVHFIFP